MALSTGGTARGYPPSIGTPGFRGAAADWIGRRLGAAVDADTELAACVGGKFVASTPQYLRLRDPSRDTVSRRVNGTTTPGVPCTCSGGATRCSPVSVA